jgi:hypothetical protein
VPSLGEVEPFESEGELFGIIPPGVCSWVEGEGLSLGKFSVGAVVLLGALGSFELEGKPFCIEPEGESFCIEPGVCSWVEGEGLSLGRFWVGAVVPLGEAAGLSVGDWLAGFSVGDWLEEPVKYGLPSHREFRGVRSQRIIKPSFDSSTSEVPPEVDDCAKAGRPTKTPIPATPMAKDSFLIEVKA